MLHNFFTYFKKNHKRKYTTIDPDEIFLDSQNLPDFNTDQFEGRIEKPISKSVIGFVGIFIFFVGCVFTWKVWDLQITEGASYAKKSANNSLHTTKIFADRGLILDRNGLPLAWNEINTATTSKFSLRSYATSTGFSTTIGYIKYPSKDSSGFYIQDSFTAKDGLEKIYDTELSGEQGRKIEETDAHGNIISESIVDLPKDGDNLNLSIDLKVQRKLYQSMLDIAGRAGYQGGAGVIMDIHTGEIIASSNFPEYESNVMTDGNDTSKINTWIQNKNHPFLNRVVNGSYTPGSIVKPFVAIGVLDQGVIDPKTKILSTGSISVPNPYNKNKPSIFRDWKAHGYVDMREAIAVSSDVYFYEVSGGFEDQKGIGIDNLQKYMRMFGFGTTTNINFPGEKRGILPDAKWKAENFNGEIWRVGDTYNTSIGQYGFQVTPIQAVRSTASIANGGKLLVPTFLKGKDPQVTSTINLNPSYFKVAQEGMRLTVTEGTALPLNEAFVKIAAKTGTAQLGVTKDFVNSWVVGYWPYDKPHYAFALVMEKGGKNNQFSSTLVMKEVFDWMGIYAREYLE